jgi:hypothetical protein
MAFLYYIRWSSLAWSVLYVVEQHGMVCIVCGGAAWSLDIGAFDFPSVRSLDHQEFGQALDHV